LDACRLSLVCVSKVETGFDGSFDEFGLAFDNTFEKAAVFLLLGSFCAEYV